MHRSAEQSAHRKCALPLIVSSAARGFLLLAVVGLLRTGPEAAAQHLPDTAGVEQDVEAALEDLDDETGDPTQLAELLTHLAEHPFDLNTATAEELSQIPALTPFVARNVIRFRAQSGPFTSLSDLRRVDGVTEDVYRRARPYLTVRGTPEATDPPPGRYPAALRPGEIVRNLRYEIIQRAGRRLDLGRGYQGDTTRAYPGAPDRLYTRLRVRSGHQVSLNLTLEKDPGERFGWDPTTHTYFFDYATAHVALQDFGRLRRLVVGDFAVGFGQGVVLWRSSAFGKGREPVRSLARFGAGITPYGSTDENRFFRGVAATLLLTPTLALTAFGSRRSLDATVLHPDTTTGDLLEERTTSVASSGLHRLPRELDGKDALGERVVGGGLEYTRGRVHLGAAAYHSRFDPPLAPAEEPYRRYRFSGRQATMMSTYGHVFLGDFLLFGELARDPDGVLGGVGGVQMQFSRQAEGILLARSYPRDFTSLHGHAFGEAGGTTQNETGIYTGLRVHPGEAWTVAAYVDQFRFPWLRYGVPRPSTGHDALLLLEHQPRRWLSVYLQARSETKEAGATVSGPRGLPLPTVRLETRQSLRLHGDYWFSDRLRLRARTERVRFLAQQEAPAYGLLLYQDVRWRLHRRLQLDLRLAFFDTDRYDARVYAYENDLLYTSSVPAFTGRGQRSYLLLTFTPLERLMLQVKYASTRLEDEKTIGSGLDEVEGNRLRELRAQLRWRF